MNVMGLIQLCQSAHPGGYGYVLGVEQMARCGQLSTAEQLEALVQTVLQSRIGPSDGVATGIAFRAARTGEYEQLPTLCASLAGLPPAMRMASLHMGQRLWGISRDWDWAAGIHQQLDGIAGKAELHHAVAFGTLVSETTSSQIRAIATYLLNTARGIILAAIHAIPLDELTGQQVLASMQPTITQLASACVDKSPADIRVL